ncbi:PREDICTED: bcl-2-like protein 1 isoform X4 [Rhinopithecus bieti]|uniref:bcl-2-like protein 1 isoform X4 n=1 Tax=Rhinopithecus bieti TaxID=61621 RepID=UPI00083C12DF|nr:PREDICTED: bcl-2-like protein 1 isoform X4 [Rhinopithecus bieti]
MSQSNRELVVDFLSYKLSQKGYSWSQFSDVEENRTEAPEGTESEMETPSAINGNPSWHLVDSPAVNGATGHSSSLDAREVIPMAAVKQALREAGDEFELRYRRAFSDLTSQLHITPGTAYQSFEQTMLLRKLFVSPAHAHVQEFLPGRWFPNFSCPSESPGRTLLWNSMGTMQQPRAERARSASTAGS